MIKKINYKPNFGLLLLFLFFSYTFQAQQLTITLANDSEKEKKVKEKLQKLLKEKDVSNWIFKDTIVIDENRRIPGSHPVLTLTARYVNDDELLLSTFVHEQIHWFTYNNHDKVNEAVKELEVMFPKVPYASKEGAKNERSTYVHLIVNFLEYKAARELQGELKAKQIMDYWMTHHYTWIYKTVLERNNDLSKILFKHDLIPNNT